MPVAMKFKKTPASTKRDNQPEAEPPAAAPSASDDLLAALTSNYNSRIQAEKKAKEEAERAERERVAAIEAARKAEEDRTASMERATREAEEAAEAKAQAERDRIQAEVDAALQRENAILTVQAGARGRKSRKTAAVLRQEALEARQKAASIVMQQGARSKAARKRLEMKKAARTAKDSFDLAKITADVATNTRARGGGVFSAMANLMVASGQADNKPELHAPPDSVRDLLNKGLQASLLGLAKKREEEAVGMSRPIAA